MVGLNTLPVKTASLIPCSGSTEIVPPLVFSLSLVGVLEFSRNCLISLCFLTLCVSRAIRLDLPLRNGFCWALCFLYSWAKVDRIDRWLTLLVLL